MKKGKKKGLSLLLSLFMTLQWIFGVPSPVQAYDWEMPGVSVDVSNAQVWNDFRYVVTESEVSIVGYSGSINSTLEIPSEIDGLPVTRIENDAFYDQEGLIEVVIPVTVIEIGSNAFHSCCNLQTFTIDAENPVYCVKNGLLLDKSESILIRCPNGRYGTVNDIPETVFLIADSAFEDCISLTSITLPQSVIAIGKLAFSYCTSLNSIYFPEGLQKIGDGAFQGCIALQNVQLPSGLQQMGMMAFAGCQAMSEVTISALSGTIPNSAFYGCSALQRVVISEGVTVLAEEAFAECTALQEVQLPETLETIREKAFQNCNSMQQITIPASVFSLNAASFLGCTALSGIYVDENNANYTVQDGVLLRSNLEELVFCPPALPQTEYTIPDSVITIDDYAFQGCAQLETVKLNDGLSQVGTGAFLDCVSLCSVEIPETVIEVAAYAFGYGTDPEEETRMVCVPYFLISCYAGTAAEQYALENGFDFQILPSNPICTTTTVETKPIETTSSEVWTQTTTVQGETTVPFTTNTSAMDTMTTVSGSGSVSTTTLSTTTTTMVESTSSLTTTASSSEWAPATTITGIPTSTTTTIVATTDTTTWIKTTTTTTSTTLTTVKASKKTTTTTSTTTVISTDTSNSSEISFAGDVDGDGNVSVEDAVMVLTYYAKRAACLPAYLISAEDLDAEQEALKRADMDGSGILTVEDAVLILEKYAKQSAGLL